ncbi:hypothetical protein DFH06DRAFT_1142175 [Mycena polygramma]|nr:hypothetical protein DFH06DRAFT_1142175 [Mycena polygramma]
MVVQARASIWVHRTAAINWVVEKQNLVRVNLVKSSHPYIAGLRRPAPISRNPRQHRPGWVTGRGFYFYSVGGVSYRYPCQSSVLSRIHGGQHKLSCYSARDFKVFRAWENSRYLRKPIGEPNGRWRWMWQEFSTFDMPPEDADPDHRFSTTASSGFEPLPWNLVSKQGAANAPVFFRFDALILSYRKWYVFVTYGVTTSAQRPKRRPAAAERVARSGRKGGPQRQGIICADCAAAVLVPVRQNGCPYRRYGTYVTVIRAKQEPHFYEASAAQQAAAPRGHGFAPTPL